MLSRRHGKQGDESTWSVLPRECPHPVASFCFSDIIIDHYMLDQASFGAYRLLMTWAKHRLEGRALDHGFVSWVRAQQNSAAVCRSRCIQMLRADGTVDKVVAPHILASMQWCACELARDLQKTASVHIQFAEQTVGKAQDDSLSIDLRALQRRKEVWIEVKWTRDHLHSALASA